MTKPFALLVDDDQTCIEALREIVEEEGFETGAAGTLAEAERRISARSPDLVLLDLVLPDGQGLDLIPRVVRNSPAKVILLTGHASVETVVAAMKLGAHDYLVKPVDPPKLRSVLDIVFQGWMERESEEREPAAGPDRSMDLLGASRAMLQLKEEIARVAPTDATVFITGETGTGKGMVAARIHDLGPRSHKPFVPVSCSSLSTNLLESELFGHERGSFTGATRRHQGYFERANGGTIFLDEITEMPIDLQSKLLKVLECGAFTRVGGDAEVRVDVRVMAASNRRPAAAVREGRFRQDLLYRLTVFPIYLAPLREREDDVILLAEHFLTFLNALGKTRKRLSASCRAALKAHPWPGNVRELKNALRRAYILADQEIGPESFAVAGEEDVSEGSLHMKIPFGGTIADAEKRIILATLDHCAGHRGKTADTLGISPKTLYNRLVEYGVG